MKAKNEFLEIWYSKNTLASIIAGHPISSYDFPDRNKTSLQRWINQLEQYLFKFTSESVDLFGIEYYRDIYMVKFIEQELYRLRELKVHTWNPMYWLEEIYDALYYLQIRENIPLVIRKDAIYSRIKHTPSFLQTGISWMVTSKIPNYYYKKALRIIGYIENFLNEIREWLYDSKIKKVDIDRSIENMNGALKKFEIFLQERVVSELSTFHSSTYSNLIKLVTGKDVEWIKQALIKEIQERVGDIVTLATKYLKSIPEGVPYNQKHRVLVALRFIHKTQRYMEIDQVGEHVTNLIYNVKSLVSQNQIIDIPKETLRVEWAPPFYKRHDFFQLIYSPEQIDGEVSKLSLIADDFSKDRDAPRPLMNRYQLEVEILRRVYPGEFSFHMNTREAGNRENIQFPFTESAWGYFILDHLISLGYRNNEVDFHLVYQRTQLKLLLEAFAEIRIFYDMASQEDIKNELIEIGLLSDVEVENIMDAAGSGIAKYTPVFTNYLRFKEYLSGKSLNNKFFENIFKLGNFPVDIINIILEKENLVST